MGSQLFGNIFDFQISRTRVQVQDQSLLPTFLKKSPLQPWWPLLGSPILMDPHLSQQHTGLQHAIMHPQEEVTRPKAKFKPNLPEKSEVDGGAIGYQQICGCTFGPLVHCSYPQISNLRTQCIVLNRCSCCYTTVNVRIESLDARSEVCKKSLHSNYVNWRADCIEIDV